MEARVSSLEVKTDRLISDVAELRSDMGDVKSTLARIEGKLDSKVDWKWATGIVAALMLVILRNEIMAFFSSTP